ncbi:hypothetical protein NAEGRDRAFT_79150 [Naegleria gruberi]|uniref:Uncharacterized protein n=1 Tax=Naegleria gruberi TaxID=5762 RepID=D2V9X2_NAEGR|nr:uncharacterized protein NAEGRDRAFT_79150 [Naegleria gruberi]EFC46323.1 hypothetical protein NAEGRDRAFT_79150 [Naegleria gruberi]|eukprot:XP_002679067.1 hypothetical protein NAEGRDRAFT_79150 [Naegleria gruberi strain NEG-M]
MFKLRSQLSSPSTIRNILVPLLRSNKINGTIINTNNTATLIQRTFYSNIKLENQNNNDVKEKEGSDIQQIKKLDLQELKNDKNFDYELFEKKKKVIDKKYEEYVKLAESKADFEWYEKLILYPILAVIAYYSALWCVEYLKEDSPPFKRALERGERKRQRENKKLWEEIVTERNKIVELRESENNK